MRRRASCDGRRQARTNDGALDYSRAMASAELEHPPGFAMPLTWRRVAFTLAVSVLFGFYLSTRNVAPTEIVIARAVVVGVAAMLGFGLFEQWPRGLPAWLPRWSLQALGVVAAVPVGAWCAYWIIGVASVLLRRPKS